MNARLLTAACCLLSSTALAAPLVVNGANSPYTINTGANDTWDSVTVESGGVLLINAEVHVTAGDFVVRNGGVVRTSPGTAVVNIDAPGRTVDVQFGGMIDLNGLGLLGGGQPGNAFGCSAQTLDPVTLLVVAGGSVQAGGSSIARGGGSSAPAYGNQLSPPLRGGGSACGNYSYVGSNGGGALLVTAGTLRVDGNILANGNNGGPQNAGGGAGGSISATVGTFAGTGAVTALGGNGNGSGGGGSGGRIYVSLATNSFTGSIGTSGGVGGAAGGLGTVYIRSLAGVQYVRGGTTDLGTGDTAASIVFGAGGYLRLTGPASVTSPIVVPGNATLELAAGTSLAAATLVSPVDGTLVVTVPASRTGELTLNGTMLLNSTLTITGNLTLSPTSTTTHNPGNRSASLVVSGTLDVQGTIDVSGRGCRYGNSFDMSTRTCLGTAAGYAGGSYGGRGGEASVADYGSQDAPAELGSSGGNGSYGYLGGFGGGLIRLQAATLNVDGLINADGTGGTGYDSGGGSGGGIRIDVTTLSGAGIIRARGGPNSDNRGSGGGGRISANFTSNGYTGVISAQASVVGVPGVDGTVRLKSAANALTVVNGRFDLTSAYNFASVTLAGSAWLNITGAPTVTAQVALPATNRISLNTIDALSNLGISNNIAGTLELNAPFTLGPQTVPGRLVVNADSTLGNVTASGTVEVNAALSVPDLTLNAGANMTHAVGNTAMSVAATGTVTVGAGAKVDLDLKGLPPSWTYDPVTLTTFQYGAGNVGGSHGAAGGGAAAPAPYGSATQPIRLGGGGGTGSYGYLGGRGGGRMRLTAGTLRVDGSISARGGNHTGYSSGGGAGGSLWMSVTNFAGVGNIYAVGGVGEGGGGAGGRISIDYASRTHTGSITAAGGAGNPAGGLGSVRVQSTAAAPDLVLSTGEWHVTGGQTYNSITLQPGSVLHFDGPAAVTVPLVIPTGTTVWLNTADAFANVSLPSRVDGTLVLNAALSMNIPTQLGGTLWVRYPVTLLQTLDMLPGATIRLDDVLTVNGHLTMATGGTITHSLQSRKLDLRVSGRLLVPLGAAITGDALGYPGGNLGAYGCSGTRYDVAVSGPNAGSGQNSGGSFGGLGGGATANAVYGTATSVEFLGSGGGCGSYGYTGGNGGGLLRVTASVVELYGHIRASGQAGSGYSAGGGSGGGIHVVAVAMLGNGLVRANGAAGGGGGSGGRIHLEVANNSFTGTVEALGGGGSPVGAVGTTDVATTTAAPVIVSVPASVARVNTAWSYDADGVPTAAGTAPLTWSLQSGPPSAAVNPSTGAFTWTPAAVGRYNFVLRVTNGLGFFDQSFSVDALSPPAVVSSGASSGQLGAPYHYNAADTLQVTGSQPLTFTATVAPPGAPSFDVDQAGKVTWTPTSQGTFAPCVRVENPVGSTDHCFTVTVSAAVTPPAITSTPPTGGSVGLPYSYQALATGSAPMTFAFLPGAAPAGATVSATGQVQWTPATPGSAFFCLRASNAGGADTQCWEVLVTPVPESPRITSSCAPLATVGQPYHYDPDDTVAVSGTAPITFSLVTPPAGLAIDASGRVGWTPSASGAFTFGIRADNSAGSFTQTCLVTVRSTTPNAGAPLILRLANPVAAVGVPYLYDVGGKLRADGQKPITWSKTAGPGNFRVAAASGAVSWTPNAVGVQTLTVKATNAAGEDSYTFDVDVRAAAPSPPRAGIKGGTSMGGSAPYSATVDGSDSTSSAPIVSWRWSFGDGSPDAEGETVTHTWTTCGGYVLRLTVTDEYGQTSTAEQLVVVDCNGVKPPAARIVMSQRQGQGSLAANFSADIIPGSGTIHGQQWLSTDGYSSDQVADTHTFGPGTHTLQLIVVDSNGLTAIDRVQVFVADAAGNEPPRVSVWATPSSAPAPAQVQFGADAYDPDGSLVSGAWTFLDGNTSNETSPTKSYPDAAFDRATFTVVDDKGLAAAAFVEVYVTSVSGDAPPEIISTPRLSIFAGQLYTYDKDGLPTVRGSGPFSFALAVKPEGATIDPATGLLQWTPAAALEGSFDFTLEVTGKSGKATQAWKVEVVRLGEVTPPAPASGCACGAVDVGGAWLGALALARLLARRRRGPLG